MSASNRPGVVSLYAMLMADAQSSIDVVRRVYEAWSDGTRNAAQQTGVGQNVGQNKEEVRPAPNVAPSEQEFPQTGLLKFASPSEEHPSGIKPANPMART